MNNRADPMLADPLKTPLQDLDVSDPRRFEQDCWQPCSSDYAKSRRCTFKQKARLAPLVDYPV